MHIEKEATLVAPLFVPLTIDSDPMRISGFLLFVVDDAYPDNANDTKSR